MASTNPTLQQHSVDIDALLQQYLCLLDTYTSLRADLSLTLSSINQHIARANFSAPRGVRYGQDLYDERMRASRHCLISQCDSLSGMQISIPEVSPPSAPDTEDDLETRDDTTADDTSGQERLRGEVSDPLRMFGILVPPSLRAAREAALKTVDGLVPRVVQTDMEMREVEVRIRRARKRMGKVEREIEREMEREREREMGRGKVGECVE